jgi:phosphate ABC transporter permease protein PstC
MVTSLETGTPNAATVVSRTRRAGLLHDARRADYSIRDRALGLLCACFLFAGLAVMGLALAFIAIETGIVEKGLPDMAAFLWREEWSPLASPPRLGIIHAWVSTLYVTGLSLAIAIPAGFGIGIYAAEAAPYALRRVLQPSLELLAGIPAVVYGFFGYVTLVKLFERWFSLPTGECVLAAGIILAVMVLPFIASTSAEAIGAVIREYKEATLSLGVTRLYFLSRVVWAKALPGLLAAVALGLARGLGETLAVLMLSGNSAVRPERLVDRGQPITALLATELGETVVRSQKYQVLFTAGFFLMLAVLALNLAILFLKKLLFRGVHER